MSASPTVHSDSMVPVLRDRLSTRLRELDIESQLIRAALAELGAGSTTAAKPRRGGASSVEADRRLLEALASSPGARGSMLALMTGIPSPSVTAQLEGLAASGRVRRAGRGWVLTSL